MSLLNGDKSRAGRRRKSQIAQKAKNRLLKVIPVKPAATAPAAAAKK